MVALRKSSPLCLFLLLTACASTKSTIVTPPSSDENFSGPSMQEPNVHVEGLPNDKLPLPPEVISPPVPRVDEKPQTCLILGPGMAKGLAHAGVIKAFARSGIIVDCVIGVEIGALVGAYYALDGNINNVMWQLFKVKREQYLDFPFFSLKEKLAQGKKLHNLLSEYFRNRRQ